MTATDDQQPGSAVLEQSKQKTETPKLYRVLLLNDNLIDGTLPNTLGGMEFMHTIALCSVHWHLLESPSSPIQACPSSDGPSTFPTPANLIASSQLHPDL